MLTVELTDGVNVVTEDITITVENDPIDDPTIPTLDVVSSIFTENDPSDELVVTAADDDFDVLTVTLSGADAALFSLQGDTVDMAPFATIAFNASPDFENPTDADGDNVYELTVEVTDGVNVVTEDITITVENDPSDDSAGGSAKSSVLETEASLADESNTVLASFGVENEGLVDLTETALSPVTLSDIESLDVMPEATFSVENDVEFGTADSDAIALEMQFAADLLMLQESAIDVDA